MARSPQPVVYSDGELALAAALSMPQERLAVIKQCPDCEGLIIPCDNDVWLDARNNPDEGWFVTELGGMRIAMFGGAPVGGSHHGLHEHQPDERD